MVGHLSSRAPSYRRLKANQVFTLSTPTWGALGRAAKDGTTCQREEGISLPWLATMGVRQPLHFQPWRDRET